MKKIITIIVCALILIFGAFLVNNQYEEYKNGKVVQALKSKKIDINTVKAGNDFKDLIPLKSTLGDKRIVAMGEATHGTKEFFQMKHRMLEFLVEKMGYNVFGIEACMSNCMAVNDYVLYGKGDAEKVVGGMGFWTWNTKEVVNMVKWMREYNKNHDKKVKFYGFDMQLSDIAAAKVTEYLKKVDPVYESQIDSVLGKFRSPNVFDNKDVHLPGDKVKEIINIMGKNKNNYINKSSKEDYEIYKQNLNIIYQAYDMLHGKQSDAEMENKRDKYMAENVKWILDFEGQDAKIMLWAHNTHVDKQEDNLNNGDYNVKRMGSNLYDMYKDKLYVIGFQFNEGSAIAVDKTSQPNVLKKCTLKTAKKESAPYMLSKVSPLFFIDFKTVAENKYIKNFISSPQSCRDFGANFNGDDKSYVNTTLNESYDGLIYIDKTTHSEPNYLISN
ncbi:erythromycin esterase family protein [Clostridium drakei]|uniref:Erythromycin esterase n=1 Tax=Clostridium drakei TaxID=332101 RepID=A0A2U8DQN5_9CLOT|nr:erythromycin esterase family protein [Clostridium drakei]AWI05087.1 erythromycin esterase [Clostridium drakei]